MFLPLSLITSTSPSHLSEAGLLDWTCHLVRALWNFSCLCPICLVGHLVTVHSPEFLVCQWDEQKEGRIDGKKEGKTMPEKTLNFLHLVH